MISKNQQKLLRALAQKKYRRLEQKFLVQGEKNILELLDSNLGIDQIFATSAFIDSNANKLSPHTVITTTEDQLAKVSTLVTNDAAIAVVNMPEQQMLPVSGLVLVLDGVSDPGNLGTIIRVADWYGISQIVLSQECADPYNPKTISATMGSFARVATIRANLSEYLPSLTMPIYGAYLGGESLHSTQFNGDLALVMGSESHGISQQLAEFITHRVTIPAFGGAESLNVAMATGIILDNIKRQQN